MPSGLLDVQNFSIPAELGPLVKVGYRSLAARAIEGIAAWQSGLKAGICAIADGKLAKLGLPGFMPAPHMFVVTGGTEQEIVIGKPLEGIFTSAGKDLSALAESGDIAALNYHSLTGMQFALDYGTFKQQPTVKESLGMVLAIAVSHYSAVGSGEFAGKLEFMQKFRGIRIAQTLNSGAYTDDPDDRRLLGITFQVDVHGPVVVNVINGLRVLYRAAMVVLPQQAEEPSAISERIAAAASASGIALPASVSGFYSNDKNAAKGMAELLGLVSVHKGVEAIIEGCNELHPRLKEALKLAKVLDTVKTGSLFYNRDRPYSCAIGLAELVG